MWLLNCLHYVPRYSLHITSSLFLREISSGEDYSPDDLKVEASVWTGITVNLSENNNFWLVTKKEKLLWGLCHILKKTLNEAQSLCNYLIHSWKRVLSKLTPLLSIASVATLRCKLLIFF